MNVTVPCPVCPALLRPEDAVCAACGADFRGRSASAIVRPSCATACRRAGGCADAAARADRHAGRHAFRCSAASARVAWARCTSTRSGAQAAGGDQGADAACRRSRGSRAFCARRRLRPRLRIRTWSASTRSGELQSSKTPYFVMQYIEGQTLIRRSCWASGAGGRGAPVVAEVAEALAAAHARGLVHRAIGPANIMVDVRAAARWSWTFGISATTQRAEHGAMKLTAAGTTSTPRYMSPEQAAGAEATESPMSTRWAVWPSSWRQGGRCSRSVPCLDCWRRTSRTG